MKKFATSVGVYMICWVGFICLAYSKVIVIEHEETIHTFKDEMTGFGPSISENGMKGKLVYFGQIHNTSCLDYGPQSHLQNSIALMRQHGCDIVNMVMSAQRMNYSAVIIGKRKNAVENLMNMSETTASSTQDINIPSVFVEDSVALYLLNFEIDQMRNAYIQITREEDETSAFTWTGYIVAGAFMCILFTTICSWNCSKYCRSRTNISSCFGRKRRTSMPSFWNTSEIHEAQFKKGFKYKTCPICLEDFVKKEKLWILPCEHGFHVECIKPWLNEGECKCPVCKRMIISIPL
ncbi:E3 ubiquitin-protein ligase Godzilla-like [Mytilus galloprovincialis]|uniref:E3 ubiquitin-protein ligase Godzilla-like n=1 Tax=Mytilus galloprovincialis TaxID=29158 RepID=UPI003F7BD570